MNLKLSVPKGVDIDSVSFSLPFDIDKKAKNANGHLTATKDKLTVYYDDKAVREFAVSDISKITVEQLIGCSMLCVRDMHGRDYEKVDLTRLVPFNDENRYISVSYKNEEDEWKEIGVIKDLEDLAADTKKTADDYLKLKYYIPEIKKIHRITDNQMGYLFLEADTTAGEKKIAVYDWWHNFRVIHGKMLAVTDADGNRYSVPDVDRLDKASIKKLQLFI